MTCKRAGGFWEKVRSPLFWFLRRLRLVVCVNPWAKGSPPLTFPLFHFRPIFHLDRSRGTEHSLANSVQRSYALEGEARIDHPCVPARTFLQAVTPLFPCLFPWWFHDTSPKPFPPQQRCSLSRFVTAVKGNNHCSNTYNCTDFSPCCSTAILPIVAIESN